MTELPKNFPEYSILYRNLSKKIEELKERREKINDLEVGEKIQEQIERYRNECKKIESLFPENFFNDF